MNKTERERMAGLNRARFKGGSKSDLLKTASRSAVSSATGGVGRTRVAVPAGVVGRVAKIKTVTSFGKKISQHQTILMKAVIFDIFALLPFISVAFNLAFGLVLYLHFGPKKKGGGSEITKIALPVMAGSALDFFVGILPVNIAATLIRIALS